MRFRAIFGGLLLAAAWAASGMSARAADLGAFYAPNSDEPSPSQPLTFGTGWYLRGDAAYSSEDHPTYSATLNGFDRNATGNGYSFGLGAGYAFNSWLRADVTGDYLDPFRYQTVNCGPLCLQAKSTIQRWDAMGNAYIDLGTWFGVTPYVGGGMGIAGSSDTGSTISSLGTVTAAPTAEKYNLAWAAMAGVSYALTSHTLIDVGYRYLDLGKTALPLYPLAPVQKSLTTQQVRVGLRYMID